MTICVLGIPPSKKNSRIMNWKQRKSLPSREYENWIDSAVMQIRICTGNRCLAVPVRVQATFYRDLRADLDNLVSAFADALQRAGALKNDRQIREWSAKLIADKSKPRIEAVIEAA